MIVKLYTLHSGKMEIVGLLDNLLLNMELVQAVLPKYSDIVTNFS